MEKYGVIMAGGGGTRFWPLSRATAPKQFLNITGEDSMINDTIKRIKDIIPPERVIIVTNKAQEKMLNEVILEDIPKDNVLIEPVGRNTAPCIGYAAMVIKKRCGDDAVMGVFPSDHYIKNVDEFQRVLKSASNIAERTKKLVTMGITPTYPSTGYWLIHTTFVIKKPITRETISTSKLKVWVCTTYVPNNTKGPYVKPIANSPIPL
jgi:mannose-1-phosphate guanylyltransferase